ncbi:hypothetical protein P4M26_10110 [Pseudomonas aeruginosa]|nr:hypothetical protein [Pseudomonas aeruginosa]
MTNETKTDRQRRLARERQRAKRERDALRRAALGGRRFNMDMYQGTADALDLDLRGRWLRRAGRGGHLAPTQRCRNCRDVTRHVLPN